MSRRLRYPLPLQLLLLLALNFLLVAALFAALPGRAGLGWDLLLTTAVRERLLDVGDALAARLSASDASQWPQLLEAEGRPREVRLVLRDGLGGGPPRGDRPPPPPRDDHPSQWDQGPRPPPPDRHDDGPPSGPGGPQTDRDILADMIAIEHRGWSQGFAVRIPMQVQGRPVDLDVQTGGVVALLRFLGVADWWLFLSLAIVATGLVWAPFAWQLTRALAALTGATRTIAQGRFDVRLPARRGDELGALAESVNDMAARLERQVETQKQFVADVAHEVTAPLARLRVGLELLEAVPEARRAAVHADLEADAGQMSALLDELLLFARTGETTHAEPARACSLAELVQLALEQEAVGASVAVSVSADLAVLVPPALVRRALANLLRNALRYGQREVEVVGEATTETVQITVRDRGPGVPESAIERLGEPFYRPDFARNRADGGTGLGLAIVRRCIAATKGSVRFGNRVGGGFEAVVQLPRA